MNDEQAAYFAKLTPYELEEAVRQGVGFAGMYDAPYVGRAALALKELVRRAELVRGDEHPRAPVAEVDESPSYNREAAKRMTAALRAGDRVYDFTGGTTRHYVIECLLPILEEHRLKLVLLPQEPK